MLITVLGVLVLVILAALQETDQPSPVQQNATNMTPSGNESVRPALSMRDPPFTLDWDLDGVPDLSFLDRDLDGLWETWVFNTPRPVPDLPRQEDLVLIEQYDMNSDGEMDDMYYDSDGDGDYNCRVCLLDNEEDREVEYKVSTATVGIEGNYSLFMRGGVIKFQSWSLLFRDIGGHGSLKYWGTVQGPGQEGVRQTWWVDLDGDGQTDRYLEDACNSGVYYQRIFLDVDGDGAKDHMEEDEDGDGRMEVLWKGTDISDWEAETYYRERAVLFPINISRLSECNDPEASELIERAEKLDIAALLNLEPLDRGFTHPGDFEVPEYVDGGVLSYFEGRAEWFKENVRDIPQFEESGWLNYSAKVESFSGVVRREGANLSVTASQGGWSETRGMGGSWGEPYRAKPYYWYGGTGSTTISGGFLVAIKLSYNEVFGSLGGHGFFLGAEYFVFDRDTTLIAVLLPPGCTVMWM